MARYSGRKGMVYISTTGTGAAALHASLTQWTLNLSTDNIDVTCFQDTNKRYVQGLPDRTGSFSGIFDDSDVKVFTGTDSADGVKLYLYPSADAPGRYFYGPAWIDSAIDVPVAGAITISGDFIANGAWGQVLS